MSKIFIKLLANLYIRSDVKIKIIKKWKILSIDNKKEIVRLIDKSYEIQAEIFKAAISINPKLPQLIKSLVSKNIKIGIKNKELKYKQGEGCVEDILLDKLNRI